MAQGYQDLTGQVIRKVITHIMHHQPNIHYMTRPDAQELAKEIMQYNYTLIPHERAVTEEVPIEGIHPYLGIEMEKHPDYRDTIIVQHL